MLRSSNRIVPGYSGKLPAELHGHDVLVQMHIQGQFQCARLSEVIYRLQCRNRRSRNVFVMHMGGEFIRVLPHSLSALMFSNKSLQATRDGRLSSASRFTSFGLACLSSGR